MSQPFGYVDLSKPHTVIDVHHAAVIQPLRRARLNPGRYYAQGNVLNRLGATRERRMMVAGVFTARFVSDPEDCVRADTIQDGPPADDSDETGTRSTSLRANAKLGTLAKLLGDVDVVSSGGADFRLEFDVLRCRLTDGTTLELSPNCLEATDMTVASFIGSLLDREEPADDQEEADAETGDDDSREEAVHDAGPDLPTAEDPGPEEGGGGDTEADSGGAERYEPSDTAPEPASAVEEPMDEAALIAANLMAMDAETRSEELRNLADTRPSVHSAVAETLGSLNEEAEGDGPSAADILGSLDF